MKMYSVKINGRSNGYMNSLEHIKDGLYELFGDVSVATDINLMTGKVNGLTINIVERKI